MIWVVTMTPPPDQLDDQPPLSQHTRVLPSAVAPAAAGVAAPVVGGTAGDADGESGGTRPQFPRGFTGLLKLPAVLAVRARQHGGGGGGNSGDSADVPPVEGDFMPTTRHSEDGIGGDGGGGGSVGDYLLEKGGTEPSAQASKASVDGGFGGGGSLPKGNTPPTRRTGNSVGVGISAASPAAAGFEQEGGIDVKAYPALTVTTSTADISTRDRDEFTPAYHEASDPSSGLALVGDETELTFDETGGLSSTARRRSSSGPGLGRAVGEAALELARNSQIPGVNEAAMSVSTLVNLLMDNQNNKKSTEASMRRCRSIIKMLERASTVLVKGGETTGKAERDMMEDVLDAIFDLVELIKTYQSKNKLAQLMTSTLFRRRQDEMGAVVDRAVIGLQLGLHVRVGTDVHSIKKDVSAFKEGVHVFQGSIEEAQSKILAEARSAKRKRRLDQLEIPEEHVTVTDELLGKGGFGEVFLADYNGRNAAVKVLHISHDLARHGENAILDRSTAGQLKRKREETVRKAFLLELSTMIRLRSPYTVDVYGAVTSMHDRLILVMELLAGGDLRTLLKTAEQPLPENQCRQIIGDICAGMAFLHRKNTVHGDLKSANVLLDGAGRAKIGDFGTLRWTQHTMSTGLATFTTKSSTNTQMSLAWSAPEVLDAEGSTYASDVYSFGVVVWEVISRELPWAAVTHPKEVYIRVVLKNMWPVIADDAPAKLANVARSCWAGEARERPTFSAILEGIKANGWEH